MAAALNLLRTARPQPRQGAATPSAYPVQRDCIPLCSCPTKAAVIICIHLLQLPPFFRNCPQDTSEKNKPVIRLLHTSIPFHRLISLTSTQGSPMEEGLTLAFVIFHPPDLHTIRRVDKTKPINISADRLWLDHYFLVSKFSSETPTTFCGVMIVLRLAATEITFTAASIKDFPMLFSSNPILTFDQN